MYLFISWWIFLTGQVYWRKTHFFKKNNVFWYKIPYFFVCLFACMTLYMASYSPLAVIVSGRKSVFNLIDNPLCTMNYFSLAVYKVISVFSFQKFAMIYLSVYSVIVCWACWVYRLMFFIKKFVFFSVSCFSFEIYFLSFSLLLGLPLCLCSWVL